jgi:hypothetical protein
MYCSSCGIDSVEGLKYCKRCGVNLTLPLDASQPKDLPFALIIAVLIFIGGVFMAGLTMPFLITKELSNRGFSQGDMMTMFIIEFGVTLAVVAMLVWLLFRLIGTNPKTDRPARAVELRRNELTPPQIAAPQEPLVSVTENTTRSFEPRVYDNVSS